MDQNNNQSNWMIRVIAGGLVAWGMLLAAGAFLAPSDEGQAGDFRKLWVVAAMVAAFLAMWAFVLVIRAKKVRQMRSQNSQDSH